MQIRIGTSGWNYTEWRGSFYPKDMKPAGMLAYYSARFSTVEVNNTFYRMPTAKVVGRLGGHRAARLLLRAQGAAADHPLRPAARRGRARPPLL